MTAISSVVDACLEKDVGELNTGWEDALIPLGLALVGRDGAAEEALDWADRWARYHLAGPIHYEAPPQVSSQDPDGGRHQGLYLTQYCGEWGAASVFAALHESRPDDRLLTAATMIADHICDNSLRAADGTIFHGPPPLAKPWVDTLYYTAAPLARVHAITQDERYAVEAVRQCLLHARHLRDQTTGCYFHDADLSSGLRPSWLWARGNGWVIMAFADVLSNCPPGTPGWTELLDLYRSLVTGLLRFQHPAGLWRIVPELAESHLETSGSTMIATGILTGVVAGLIEHSNTAPVLRTWQELCTWTDATGAIHGCQLPSAFGGWESHKLAGIGARTFGAGSFIRLAAELRDAGLIDAWKSA